MILLLDIGNTHLHAGLASERRVLRHINLPSGNPLPKLSLIQLQRWIGRQPLAGAALCSVVPKITTRLRHHLRARWKLHGLELNHKSLSGIGIDYPRPETIGPDRLANALAVSHHYGAPSVVIDFGTAVTFDVVDAHSNYVGGIIAPGLEAMTSYLHEKTALLPRITLRETQAAIGKSTEEAMRIAALHGYRGMIRALLQRVRTALHCPRPPVVATGGYARLMARGLPEITAVEPTLTLEGLRLLWQRQHSADSI